jgi:hypothetical protein
VSDGPVQYICTGWNLAGLEPASGTSNAFAVAVTNDAQLTWLWETNSLHPCTIALGAAEIEAGEGDGQARVAVVRDDANGAASVELQAAAARPRPAPISRPHVRRAVCGGVASQDV